MIVAAFPNDFASVCIPRTCVYVNYKEREERRYIRR